MPVLCIFLILVVAMVIPLLSKATNIIEAR